MGANFIAAQEAGAIIYKADTKTIVCVDTKTIVCSRKIMAELLQIVIKNQDKSQKKTVLKISIDDKIA